MIQKYFVKDSHNLHKNYNNKSNAKIRISESDINSSKTTQKDRSLRTIVAKKSAQLKTTEAAKTVRMLTAGP